MVEQLIRKLIKIMIFSWTLTFFNSVTYVFDKSSVNKRKNKIYGTLTHLVLSGTGKPSKVHTNCGGGFPVATHFSEIAGPGCTVCSVNQYSSSGLASEIQQASHCLSI